ncbi:ciliary neurotrophic factor, partial [Nothoprocta perdicaria]|uniref:ciliary neurotrophic factor n=1 Tax=Nothoprocta perdicaria TaxID=30464 RepID=UPI000E1B78B7
PGALHDALAALRLRVAALAHHLRELLRLEGPAAHRDGDDDGDDDGADDATDDGAEDGADDGAGARLGLFERRLRGLAVLRELARWAVRSARDLRLIAKAGGAADADGSP